MHASLSKQQGRAAHTKPARTTPHTTVTTSTHNPLIMASSSSASNWECGTCTSSNKGGKYCAMCAIPRPKRQALLAAIAADVAAHAAVVAAPERICPSRGSIGWIWSRFGVSVRSFSRNWSVRNGRVLGESSMYYFHGTLRRLSTG
jgi:hypothetical protein